MYTLSYSLTRSAVRRFYLRELWHRNGGALLSLPILALVGWWWSRDPIFWWPAGFVSGVGVTYLGLLYLGLRTAQRVADKPANAEADGAGMRFDFDGITTHLRWESVVSARQTHDGLILVVSRLTKRSILIPRTAMSDDAEAFIVERVRAAGGRVEKRVA